MTQDELFAHLVLIVGAAHLIRDDSERRFFSEDFFLAGAVPDGIVVPGTVDELTLAVRAITGAGRPVIARGGGLSYTGGYVPSQEGSVMIDTRRLDRIVDISPDNMTVTAECGVTWEKLVAALAPHKVRPPSFGPTTGRYATLGGGLSNNAMFFGSANRGTVIDSVIGVDVVLADGNLVRTGSAGIRGGVPFFRGNGPDLTGLFLADAGAMGVKARATLKLEVIPDGAAFASFSFSSYEDMIAAAADIARSGLASECLGVSGYNPGHPGHAASPSLHAVLEGWSQRIADEHAAAVTSLVGVRGKAIEPALPKFIRSQPFGFVAHPLDAKGRLQIWTHGAFPLNAAAAAYREVSAYIDTQADTLKRHAIDVSISIAVAGTMLIVEPVLYWSDLPREIHRRGMGTLPLTAPTVANTAASEAARDIRLGFRDVLRRQGSAHMQHGKFYGLDKSLLPTTLDCLRSVKAALDPRNLCNPGALGL